MRAHHHLLAASVAAATLLGFGFTESVGFVLRLRAQQPAQAFTSSGARVRGQVVADPTGVPLAGVHVTLRPDTTGTQTIRNGMTIYTDREGRYEFSNVQPGRYLLEPYLPGYVLPGYGLDPARNAGRSIDVRAGQSYSSQDLRLFAAGSAVVRVTDDVGEPIADIPVHMEAVVNSGGRRRLIPSGGWGFTDDRGEVKFGSVPPGTYYISASPTLRRAPADFASGFGGGAQPRPSYISVGTSLAGPVFVTTYFPDVTSITDASPVPVELGQLLAIGIRLQTAHLARISGSVLTSEGRSPSSGTAMLVPRATRTLPSGLSRATDARRFPLRSDGTFEVTSVLPGEYSLSVIAARNITDYEYATTPLFVAGSDLAGVQIATAEGHTLRGRVLFEGGTPEGFLPSALRFNVTLTEDFFPSDASASSSAKPIAVGNDLSFVAIDLVGSGIVRGTPPQGWGIKSVTVNSRNVLEEPIDFNVQSLDGVEITLTRMLGGLSGVVQGSQTAPVVILFTEEKSRWSIGSNLIQISRVDQTGRYSFGNLIEGSYFVVALDRLDTGEEFNPELLERLIPRARRVSIRAGQPQSVELRLESMPR